ncbi:MAG: response regulator transcription factor [Treponemataceae bacterium]|nr:response regulator transcription factor [Treponemataceae bacterium]
MACILIAEDDRNMRLLTSARLSDKYNVLCACDGVEALEIIRKNVVDLIISDIMMPRMDGYELLKTIRQEGYTTPFLMLTAMETSSAMEKGYELGTDEYITKPFSSDELQWRVAALLRRANITENKKIVIGRTTIDSEKYAVYNDSEFIELPKKEFDLLFKLLSYPSQIFSKEQIRDSVWGPLSETGDDTVKTHINRIRNKMQNMTDFTIVTIKGLGYKAEITKKDS